MQQLNKIKQIFDLTKPILINKEETFSNICVKYSNQVELLKQCADIALSIITNETYDKRNVVFLSKEDVTYIIECKFDYKYLSVLGFVFLSEMVDYEQYTVYERNVRLDAYNLVFPRPIRCVLNVKDSEDGILFFMKPGDIFGYNYKKFDMLVVKV